MPINYEALEKLHSSMENLNKANPLKGPYFDWGSYHDVIRLSPEPSTSLLAVSQNNRTKKTVRLAASLGADTHEVSDSGERESIQQFSFGESQRADPSHSEYTLDRVFSSKIAKGRGFLAGVFDGISVGSIASGEAAEVLRRSCNEYAQGLQERELPDIGMAKKIAVAILIESFEKTEVLKVKERERLIAEGVKSELVERVARNIGSTACIALSAVDEEGEEVVVTVNLGDTRAYLFGEEDVEQITIDDSTVQNMGLSEMEAFFSPVSNLITGYVSEQFVTLLAAEIEEKESRHVHVTKLRKGQTLILGSDGVWKNILPISLHDVLQEEYKAAEEIAEITTSVTGQDTAQIFADRLTGRALMAMKGLANDKGDITEYKGESYGSDDDASVVVIVRQ